VGCREFYAQMGTAAFYELKTGATSFYLLQNVSGTHPTVNISIVILITKQSGSSYISVGIAASHIADKIYETAS
jgi:hypothetical protein